MINKWQSVAENEPGDIIWVWSESLLYADAPIISLTRNVDVWNDIYNKADEGIQDFIYIALRAFSELSYD